MGRLRRHAVSSRRRELKPLCFSGARADSKTKYGVFETRSPACAPSQGHLGRPRVCPDFASLALNEPKYTFVALDLEHTVILEYVL